MSKTILEKYIQKIQIATRSPKRWDGRYGYPCYDSTLSIEENHLIEEEEDRHAIERAKMRSEPWFTDGMYASKPLAPEMLMIIAKYEISTKGIDSKSLEKSKIDELFTSLQEAENARWETKKRLLKKADDMEKHAKELWHYAHNL